jgi:hypothetical protein
MFSMFSRNTAAQPAVVEPTVCFIGSTGTGKSTTCNTLCDSKDAFHASDGIDSCTYLTSVVKCKWSKGLGGGGFTLVDTPGLGDALGRDSEHVAAMVAQLKKLGSVNAFVIVFNGQNPRMDEGLRAMMKIFSEVFGAELLHHAILCFTRWSYDRRTVAGRRADAEEHIEQEFNELLQRDLGLDISQHRVPCVFIDNDYEKDSVRAISTAVELKRYSDELRKIRTIACALPPFECRDIKAVVSERDRLRKEKEVVERQAELDRIEAERREESLQRLLADVRNEVIETEKRLKHAHALEIGRLRDDVSSHGDDGDCGEYGDCDDECASACSAAATPQREPSRHREPSRCTSPSGKKFFKGGQFLPGGGRAPAGGIFVGGGSAPGTPPARDDGGKFYKGGQFLPGGGRAPTGGIRL